MKPRPRRTILGRGAGVIAIVATVSAVAACSALLDLNSVSYDGGASDGGAKEGSATSDASLPDANPIDAGTPIDSAPTADAGIRFCAQFDASFCADFDEGCFTSPVHYFPNGHESAPFNCDSGTAAYLELDAGIQGGAFRATPASGTPGLSYVLDQPWESGGPHTWNLEFDIELVSAGSSGLAYLIQPTYHDGGTSEDPYTQLTGTGMLQLLDQQMSAQLETGVWSHVRVIYDVSQTSLLNASLTVDDASTPNATTTAPVGPIAPPMGLSLQVAFHSAPTDGGRALSYRLDNILLTEVTP